MTPRTYCIETKPTLYPW